MPADLVKRAIEQSRNREPLVKAIALLYGARVLAIVDRDAATQAFSEGVSVAEGLPLDTRFLGLVLEEAVRLGATVDPLAALPLFRRLPPGDSVMARSSTGTMLVQSLAQSGNVETAIELLEDLDLEVGGARPVVHFASDPALRRRAMLAARERWRTLRKRADAHNFDRDEFYHLFSQHWQKLESPEAETWLDEILLAIEADPDHSISARFGERIEFHSMRDKHLFETLNVLRALKPPGQVEATLRAHPDVARAAELYPLGLDSLMAQRPPVPEGGRRGRGFVCSGSESDMQFIAGMMSSPQGDTSTLEHLLTEAHHLYRADTDANDPNLAPRVFWPSCHAYKVAMYWVGDRFGKDAAPRLDEIPDPDFILLASIDLAGGALHLPQHSGVRMAHRPNRGGNTQFGR